MLTAFARLADGRVETADSLRQVAAFYAQEGSEVWVDLLAPTAEQLNVFGHIFGLEESSLEDCLSGEQRPRIDDFDDHIFVVIYGMFGGEATPTIEPRKLSVFCSSRYLLTVHSEPMRSVQAVIQRCGRHPQHVIGLGVDFVLHGILDGVVDRYAEVVDSYDNRLSDLEDESLDPRVDESILGKLIDLRRDLLQLRHIAVSHREMLAPIARGEFNFIADALERRFSHVVDHLTKVVEEIDAHRELLNVVRDNYHSTLTGRMNQAMRTLTIFATVMLPLTLIAGVYGMNVPLWPPQDQPWSFWTILAVMAGIGFVLLGFFRRRKWL